MLSVALALLLLLLAIQNICVFLLNQANAVEPIVPARFVWHDGKQELVAHSSTKAILCIDIGFDDKGATPTFRGNWAYGDALPESTWEPGC